MFRKHATVLMGSAAPADMPLELAAAKTCLAHTEPAAGAVGLALLTRRLRQRSAGAFIHLRALNPYVESISSAATRGRRGWLARRQQTAMPLTAGARWGIGAAKPDQM